MSFSLSGRLLLSLGLGLSLGLNLSFGLGVSFTVTILSVFGVTRFLKCGFGLGLALRPGLRPSLQFIERLGFRV